jgi:hypothetical protein
MTDVRRSGWPLGALGAALIVAAVVLLAAQGRPAGPTRQWHVAAGSDGNGSEARPFGLVADALALAGAGDEVVIGPGLYRERIATTRGGTAGAPLLIRAARPDGRPTFESPGRVVTIAHPHVVLDGLVLDAAYGRGDAVRVTSGASHLVLRNLEIRRSGGDCVDMDAPADVLLERVLIHHCLDATGGRKDAHGLVAGGVERLTVRDADIHTFSGDALQFDPARSHPGWTDVRLERVRMWLEPLREATNGFAAGVVPGENGIDTKTPREGRRSRLVVSDVQAWGFTKGLMNNMAAFNIKERVDATFDRATVHTSDIAFRLRGAAEAGAAVIIRDSVLHHVSTGIRYEDEIARVIVERLTIGKDVAQPFRGVNSPTHTPDVRDLWMLGGPLPDEAVGRGRVVGPDAFVDITANDYRRRR